MYEGQLFVYSPRTSSLAFVEFARQLIKEAFAPLDPETAQADMPVEQYAETLGKLKPHFIHHPESKRHLQALMSDMGVTLNTGLMSRSRGSTISGFLTTGITYAWRPHPDARLPVPGAMRRSSPEC